MNLMETMDIHSKEGDVVLYNFPFNGYEGDQATAAKYLSEGNTYTVDHTIVYSSSTDVFLKEFPDIAFNSVMFSDYK